MCCCAVDPVVLLHVVTSTSDDGKVLCLLSCVCVCVCVCVYVPI